jgi:hypothetical protein
MSDSNLVVDMSPTQRSKVTNARMKGRVGSRPLLMASDGRTAWARLGLIRSAATLTWVQK